MAYEPPRIAVTTDIVLFTIREGVLQVLLLRRAIPPFINVWALPGGFVELHEALEDNARRKLHEETGLDNIYLEQLYTFGALGRDPRERVVSVAYVALTPADDLHPASATRAGTVAWHRAGSLPTLAFDHAEIIATARQRLVAKLDYSTIAFQFLPPQFTLSDVQDIYEIIQGQPMDKRNFRKWVLALDDLEETGNYRTGHHRPAMLYRLKNPDLVRITK